MDDSMITMFNSNRKQSSDLRKQILLLVYDAKKLLKEFSYLQSEVYRVEDDIAKFNALVNRAVDGDILPVLWCPWSASWAPETAKLRQCPSSSFWNKFFHDRKDYAYKLYGRYADWCKTFEKYCASFPASQPETHESNNKFQLL